MLIVLHAVRASNPSRFTLVLWFSVSASISSSVSCSTSFSLSIYLSISRFLPPRWHFFAASRLPHIESLEESLLMFNIANKGNHIVGNKPFQMDELWIPYNIKSLNKFGVINVWQNVKSQIGEAKRSPELWALTRGRQQLSCSCGANKVRSLGNDSLVLFLHLLMYGSTFSCQRLEINSGAVFKTSQLSWNTPVSSWTHSLTYKHFAVTGIKWENIFFKMK